MADTKITDLTALTGANIASGDDLALVDVSDTSMAASGTDKKITANELRIGIATTLGVVGIDKIWDTAGDIAVASGADTAVALPIGTAAGAAVVADPNAANKVSVQYPHGVEMAARGATSSLASTYDRAVNVETNNSTLATGVIFLHRILLPKGLSVTNITFWSMTTAGSALTNQWFALFDSSKNKLAITGDDTSTAWAANSAKTLAVTGGPYVTTTAGWYYLGIMVKGTVPTLVVANSAFGSANIRNATPLPCFTADTGLTNPASCPTTLGAATVRNTLAYAEIS